MTDRDTGAAPEAVENRVLTWYNGQVKKHNDEDKAVENLEAAGMLAADDPESRFQLGRADMRRELLGELGGLLIQGSAESLGKPTFDISTITDPTE